MVNSQLPVMCKFALRTMGSWQRYDKSKGFEMKTAKF